MANGKKQRVSKTTLHAFLIRIGACERRNVYKNISFFRAYKKIINAVDRGRHRARKDAVWFLRLIDRNANFFHFGINDSKDVIKKQLSARYLKLRSRIR